MLASQNLNELANKATARTNLGVTATGADTTYAYRANNLSDLASVATARTNLGVTATGADTTYAYRANNLSDLGNATTARANLGLGSMATQASSSVSITGGSITGITDITVADGGTGSSTAAGARTNLGAAASGANTDLTSVYLSNTGLKLKDTDATHGLIIAPGSNLTADRVLTVVTGDAARTLTLSGNATLSGGTHSGTNTGDQTITLTGDVTGSGTGSFAATIAAGVVTFAKMATAAVATAAEYLSNTASKLISVAAAWAAAVPVTITFSTTQTLDFSTFINGKITLTGNMTLQTPSNLKTGQSGCIEFIQDATGSRTLNMTNSSFVSAGGTDITLSTAANARDLIFYQILSDSKVLLSATKAVS